LFRGIRIARPTTVPNVGQLESLIDGADTLGIEAPIEDDIAAPVATAAHRTSPSHSGSPSSHHPGHGDDRHAPGISRDEPPGMFQLRVQSRALHADRSKTLTESGLDLVRDGAVGVIARAVQRIEPAHLRP
jgi:hypothetical protein